MALNFLSPKNSLNRIQVEEVYKEDTTTPSLNESHLPVGYSSSVKRHLFPEAGEKQFGHVWQKDGHVGDFCNHQLEYPH